MILSRYCKIFCDNESPEDIYLFSTRKASIIKIPAAMTQEIKEGTISENEIKTLSGLGFLADDETKDKEEMLGFMDDLNVVNKKIDVILVMNLNCNLACRYCFEGSRKGSYYMSRETADRFIGFIKRKIRESESSRYPEEIKTTFYGGEPLLSFELIVYISRNLKNLAEENGIRYSFSFISNGTLITPEVVQKLRPLGLKSFSITLDGPKRIHDHYRPFRSGKGSFDSIVKNIKDVCEMTDIQIGGNYTQDGYRAFPELLDFLIAEGLMADKISSMRFDPVTKESEGISQTDFHEGCASVNEPWLFEAGIFLRGEILKRGFDTNRIMPSVCMIELPNSIVVNYDGSIYKCPGLISREEFRAGHVSKGILDYRFSHCLDNWKNDECLECCYLPLCFGGCRYMRLVREGSMDGIDCRRPFYDAVLESFVRQDLAAKN